MPPEASPLRQVPDVEDLAEMTAALDDDGPLGDDVDEQPAPAAEPGRPEPPSREEMRDRIRAALSTGTITVEDVVADMYASQYAAEMSLRQLVSFLDRFAASGIGKRFLKRSKKDVAEVAKALDAEDGETR